MEFDILITSLDLFFYQVRNRGPCWRIHRELYWDSRGGCEAVRSFTWPIFLYPCWQGGWYTTRRFFITSFPVAMHSKICSYPICWSSKFTKKGVLLLLLTSLYCRVPKLVPESFLQNTQSALLALAAHASDPSDAERLRFFASPAGKVSLFLRLHKFICCECVQNCCLNKFCLQKFSPK